MLTTFMKKLKHLILTLMWKSKQKQKTWPLSDIETSLKFSRGDYVIIIDGLENSVVVKNPTGKIIKSQFELKEVIYTVELYGGLLRFPESSLIHQNPDDERDWKLKQLLK